MKLVIFSICKDEEQTIGELLDRMPRQLDGIDEIETLVISDGSFDKTAEIAREHGASVIEGKSQRRLAARFSEAIEYALEHNADIAVNIDGDLQFSPEDIPKMVRPIIEDDYNFVAADRFTDPETGLRIRPENMPRNKYYANRVGTWIVSNLTRQKFRDVTCGFRAYDRDAMIALNINSQYTYTQESFQLLALKRMNISAVPVTVQYFPGRKSRVVTSFFGFMANSAVNILRAYRDFAPLRFFGFIGFINFVLGFFSLGFVYVHWLNTHQVSPYKSIGFLGLFFMGMCIIFWITALLADMFDRILNNQEKILERLKHQKFDQQYGDDRENTLL
jgi:glycosyltransferase involved in cell wall biosynthesis